MLKDRANHIVLLYDAAMAVDSNSLFVAKNFSCGPDVFSISLEEYVLARVLKTIPETDTGMDIGMEQYNAYKRGDILTSAMFKRALADTLYMVFSRLYDNNEVRGILQGKGFSVVYTPEDSLCLTVEKHKATFYHQLRVMGTDGILYCDASIKKMYQELRYFDTCLREKDDMLFLLYMLLQSRSGGFCNFELKGGRERNGILFDFA